MLLRSFDSAVIFLGAIGKTVSQPFPWASFDFDLLRSLESGFWTKLCWAMVNL